MSTSSDRVWSQVQGVPAEEPSLVALVNEARQLLQNKWGKAPQWVAAAPGRVNVIGEHTDYNEGFVLPMAIDRHVVVAGTLFDGGDTAEIWSGAVGEGVSMPLTAAPPMTEPRWASYVQGVVAGFRERGIPVPAFRAVIVSDVPLGGGLSSSAALEVATATFLEGVTRTTLFRQDKARLCRRAEQDYAGVPCGVMDQLASVMGQDSGPLLIDCRDESVVPVPFDHDATVLLIANSNVKHSLGDGAYARRRAECHEAAERLGVASLRDVTPEQVEQAAERLGPLLHKRARHVVTENARTVAVAQALPEGRFERAGALMYESHRSLRDDYEVSVPEIDLLVRLAEEIGPSGGVFGSRMTGGGFGGCTVSLVRADSAASIAQALSDGYEKGTGRALTTFVARPASGARLLDPTSTGAEDEARRP